MIDAKIVQIDTGDEEREEFEIHFPDKEPVYLLSTNHDEDGWSGMESVREAYKRLANALGIPFEIQYRYDDEDEDDC